MNLITTHYKEISRDKWADFVHNHPNGNIFHTPEMVDIYENNSKHIPLVIAYSNLEGQIEGLMVAIILQEFTGMIGKFTARAIVWGGPLVLDQNREILSLLLTSFDSICNKNVVFAQFRNLWNISIWETVFGQHGYKFDEHLNILFDLKQGKDELWKGMNPARRKQINRGLRRDLHSVLVDTLNAKELATCFAILKQVYSDAKLPHPGIGYFQNAMQILSAKGYFKTALAIYNDEIVGFRFFLCYNGLLYDWYAGSKKEHYDKYPNDILPWSIMNWGIETGCHTFDFGGAGKPGVSYGVRDYKLKFGGELVNFGRFEKIYKPGIYNLASRGLKFWQKIKIGGKNNK